jgi:hypothetical protein
VLAIAKRIIEMHGRNISVDILGKSGIFGAPDDGVRKELAARVHRKSFGVGEPIFRPART